MGRLKILEKLRNFKLAASDPDEPVQVDLNSPLGQMDFSNLGQIGDYSSLFPDTNIAGDLFKQEGSVLGGMGSYDAGNEGGDPSSTLPNTDYTSQSNLSINLNLDYNIADDFTAEDWKKVNLDQDSINPNNIYKNPDTQFLTSLNDAPTYTSAAFYGGGVGSQGFAGGNLMALQQQTGMGSGGGGAVTAPIVGANRHKSILQINDFSGGLNQTTGSRDIEDNQFSLMDFLSSGKKGKLIRLGDFETLFDTEEASSFAATNAKYGLFYFVWDSYFGDTSGTTPTLGATQYIATPRDSGTTIGFTRADDLAKYNSALDLSFGGDDAPVFYSALGKTYFCNSTFETDGLETTTKVAYPVNERYFGAITVTGYGSGSHNIPNPVAIDRDNNPDTGNDGKVRVFCTNLDGSAVLADRAELITDMGANQVMVWLQWFNTSEGGWGDIVTNEITGVITDITAGTPAVVDCIAHGLSTGDIVEITGTTNFNGIFTIKEGADADKFTIVNASATENSLTSAAFTTILGGMKIANYRFQMSYVYDNGEETDLTPCSFRHFFKNSDATDNVEYAANTFTTSVDGTQASSHGWRLNDINDLTEGAGLKIKALVVNHDGTFVNKRIKGARIYYQKCETNDDGNKTTDLDDPYLLCDVDFEKGVRTDFGAGSIYNEWAGSSPDFYVEDLEIISPQNVIKYETLNLHAPDEIKDIRFKTAAVVNSIPFIGNIKYNDVGGTYAGANNPHIEPSTILFAASPAPGHVYGGRFPIRTNRIPVSGGEIKAISGIGDKLLVFTTDSLHVINVADYGSYKYENTFKGLSIAGSWQVCQTPFGVVWCTIKGLYMYDPSKATVVPLSLGKLDDEDWDVVDGSRIGYDPTTISVIVVDEPTGTTHRWYVYNFATGGFSSVPAGENSHDSNLAVNFDGFLTVIDEGDEKLYKWNATPTSSKSIELITKDFTLGSPSNKLKVFSIEISYSDSGSSTVAVYYRVNQKGISGDGAWIILNENDDSSGSTLGGGSGVLQTKTFDRNTDSGDFPIGGLNSTEKMAKSIQLRFAGTASTSFEINDISITYKEKRIK